MKLISLNTWMGSVRQPLFEFFEAKKADTDIFCLQEILHGGEEEGERLFKDYDIQKEHQLLIKISEILLDHVPYFRPHIGDWVGLAMFVRKDIVVLEEGEKFVHGTSTGMPGDTMQYNPRNLQYARIRAGERELTVMNFHGLWTGGGKKDNEERLSQSRKIVEFARGLEGDHLICGDFNLEPDTESVKILKDAGFRNLIKEYGVTSTRTSLYTKDVRFADYAFVSAGIKVNDFQVLPDEVSDHSPLYLNFE